MHAHAFDLFNRTFPRGGDAGGGGGGGGGGCGGSARPTPHNTTVDYMIIIEAHGAASDIPGYIYFTPRAVAPHLGGLGFTCFEKLPGERSRALQHRDVRVLFDPHLGDLRGTRCPRTTSGGHGGEPDFPDPNLEMRNYKLSCECPWRQKRDGTIECQEMPCGHPNCTSPAGRANQHYCYRQGFKLPRLSVKGGIDKLGEPFAYYPLQNLLGTLPTGAPGSPQGQAGFLLSNVLAALDAQAYDWYMDARKELAERAPTVAQAAAPSRDEFRYGVILNICRGGVARADAAAAAAPAAPLPVPVRAAPAFTFASAAPAAPAAPAAYTPAISSGASAAELSFIAAINAAAARRGGGRGYSRYGGKKRKRRTRTRKRKRRQKYTKRRRRKNRKITKRKRRKTKKRKRK